MGVDALSGEAAVFLDRDGTLNLPVVRDGRPYAPRRLEEFALYPEVPSACRALKAAGYWLAVATNQPDVGRGELAPEVVEAMHQRLRDLVPEIDRIEVCYDPGRGEQSTRRKPEPGMVLEAAAALGADLTKSWMVGDRWRDIDCGQRAGLRTVFIDRGYLEELTAPPDFTVASFGEAVEVILEADGRDRAISLPQPLPDMKSLNDLKIQLYADGADKAGMFELNRKPHIKGLTTNPSLMKKSGITDYETFAREILQTITTKPISFEVFSDDFAEMKRQALKITAWGSNVYTKIPITNARGESSLPLIKDLAASGVKLNITALFSEKQVAGTRDALNPQVPAVVSVFAGRIADTGLDPVPYMTRYNEILADLPKAELLWASTREVLNLFQAEAIGCAIITVPHDILAKAEKFLGVGLEEMSLDTVKTFSKDATAAGFKL